MLKPEEAVADVELGYCGRFVRIEVLVNAGANGSMRSRRLADRFEALIPLKKPYRLRAAEKGGGLRITGFCDVDVGFQGVEVPGGARFGVAENLREDVDFIIGRLEIDSWDMVFTPEVPIDLCVLEHQYQLHVIEIRSCVSG